MRFFSLLARCVAGCTGFSWFRQAAWQLAFMLLWGSAGIAVADSRPQEWAGLDGAIRATLQFHPAINGQQAQLEAAGYAGDVAASGRLPSLSVSADNVGGERQATAVIQQPLWTFGKLDSALALADAEQRAEEVVLLQVRRELLQETALAYVNIDSLRRQLQVSEQDVQEHQRLYERIQRRHQGGLASDTDVQFAWGRLVRAQSRRDGYSSQLVVAGLVLQALTQIPIDSGPAIPPPLLVLPEPGQLQQDVLVASADLLVKRQQVEVASRTREQTRYQSMPTLSFQVERDIPNSAVTGADVTRSGLVLEASVNGMGMSNWSAVRAASARQRAAEQDVYVTEVDLRQTVQTLANNRQMQERLLESQRRTVEAIANTLASFVRQYETDRKSWIEVLNTQRELTDERIELAAIEGEWQTLSLRLAAMAGYLDQWVGLPPLSEQGVATASSLSLDGHKGPRANR